MANDNAITLEVQENDFGITTTMTREEFESYFHNNSEIKYKNLELGIMDWQDGRFDILTPADNENGYEILNPNSFLSPCDAIEYAVDYLVEYDTNRNPDGTQSTPSRSKKSGKKPVVKEPVEPEYDGPRLVRVFGRDIYTEENAKASHEDIRKKLVSEYDFPNFKEGKVFYDFDSSTGTLEVLLKFQMKG